MPPPTIQYLTDIHFERGIRTRLAEIVAGLGVRRPLLVTDAGVLEAGIPERLPLDPHAVFTGVSSNPTEADAEAGVAAYRAQGCDGVVAVGGGSPLDCAKCIALLATHPGPLEQYALIRGGLARIQAGKPPLVAVPTTAGTGSEVGRAALVTVSSGQKLALISPHMIPTAAVCDPELTLGLPPRLTAATGMDAISHCVETYLSPRFNPVADAIALDGLERAVRALPTAVTQPQDHASREAMMLAALEGGLTFQKGLGLIHSLSHPLGALAEPRLHHGMLNAIFLPHVVSFNATAAPEKTARLAAAVGVEGGPDALVAFLERLVRELGLPGHLRELGVERRHLEGIPAAALADHSTATNPRPVTAAVCEAVLEKAF